MELTNSHVIITGGSRGIGAAMARSFVRAGARVSLVARSVDALEELASELGGRAFPADLLDAREEHSLDCRRSWSGGHCHVGQSGAGR